MRHVEGRTMAVARVIALVLVSGCASSPPAQFYSLNALARSPGVVSNPTLAVAIERVTFPAWLDRTQIVTRTTPNRLDVSEFHLWAGSLSDDFERVLGKNLSILLGTPYVDTQPGEGRFDIEYQLFVDVLEFEGDVSGSVALSANWVVIDDESRAALRVSRSTIEVRVAAPDYEALVAAKSLALLDLSREIAAALGELAAT